MCNCRAFASEEQLLGHLRYCIDHSITKDATGRNRPSEKLRSLFYGPFEIIQRINDVAYRVDIPRDTNQHNVFHVQWMRRHVKNDETVLPGRYPDHNEEEYVVEKILYSVRGRGRGGPLSYVVKWVGRNEVATLKANDERLAEFQGQLPNVQLLSNSEQRRRLRVLKKLGGFSA
ncbi:hypothetical protein SeLEV6574_g07145 [Synchytrium endobioticum]|uniref:Chromo domain-containing protein n=1 Tax=Synchytrium endobioticum TaxID=286115 RepID=A0A507CIV6_9FUNG|nr:hypothetical protein SeLEV6574_g07145 [Synchytrium endobioticum]